MGIRFQQVLRIATDVLPKLPQAGDGPVSLVIKGLSIYESIQKFTQGSSDKSTYRVVEMLGGAQHYINAHFVKMFFSTKLRRDFHLSTVPLDEHSNLILARKGSDTLFFLEWTWGSQPEYADFFWATAEFDFGRLLDEIWSFYPDGLHVGFEQRPQDGPRVQFSPVVLRAPTCFVGALEQQFQEFIGKQRQYARDGVPRTHLFWGPPGTGKTVFALRASRVLRGRLLFMSSEAIKHQSREMSFLLENLAPDHLIIDDLDKISLRDELPPLLNLLTEVKVRQPNLVVMITANSLNLDPALKRVGRIDRRHFIGPPPLEDRLEVLRAFSPEGTPEPTLRVLAKHSEGLTTVSLQEMGLQLRYTLPRDVLALAYDLREGSAGKEKKQKSTP